MSAISTIAEMLTKMFYDSALASMDVVHRHIHKKEYFEYQERFIDVADDGTIHIRFVADAKELHAVLSIDAGGDAWFDSYVDSTYTDPGTEKTPFNRYIDTAPASDGKVYLTPTVDVLGTKRFERLIIGGSGQKTSGGSTASRVESILAPGHTLDLIITNKAGATKDIGVAIGWYEED